MIYKKILIGCFLAKEICFPGLPSKAGAIETIKSFSSECFYSKKRQSCKIALDEISAYKLSSSIKENYSCHTRLLGLESKLLMVLIDLKKKKNDFVKFDELKRICSSSF